MAKQEGKIPNYGNFSANGENEGSGKKGGGVMDSSDMPVFSAMNTPLPQSKEYPEHNSVTRLRSAEGAADGALKLTQSRSVSKSDYASKDQRS